MQIKIEIEKEKQIATEILNEFEELLTEKEIMIPSNDREGNEYEACLYGSEYHELEDKITHIFKETRLLSGPPQKTWRRGR